MERPYHIQATGLDHKNGVAGGTEKTGWLYTPKTWLDHDLALVLIDHNQETITQHDDGTVTVDATCHDFKRRSIFPKGAAAAVYIHHENVDENILAILNPETVTWTRRSTK